MSRWKKKIEMSRISQQGSRPQGLQVRNRLVLNRGVDGETSAQLLSRLQADDLTDVKIVLLQLSNSDFAASGTMTFQARTADIQANIDTITAANPNAKIVLIGSLVPNSDHAGYPASAQFYRDYKTDGAGFLGLSDYDAALLEPFVPDTSDPHNAVRLGDTEPDGINLTPAATEILAGLLQETLEESDIEIQENDLFIIDEDNASAPDQVFRDGNADITGTGTGDEVYQVDAFGHHVITSKTRSSGSTKAIWDVPGLDQNEAYTASLRFKLDFTPDANNYAFIQLGADSENAKITLGLGWDFVSGAPEEETVSVDMGPFGQFLLSDEAPLNSMNGIEMHYDSEFGVIYFFIIRAGEGNDTDYELSFRAALDFFGIETARVFFSGTQQLDSSMSISHVQISKPNIVAYGDGITAGSTGFSPSLADNADNFSHAYMNYLRGLNIPTPAEFVDLGDIHLDSEHTQETAQEEHAGGTEKYNGTLDQYSPQTYDPDIIETVKLLQDQNSAVSLRLSDAEGGSEVLTGFTPKVNRLRSFQPRTRELAQLLFTRTIL